MQRKRADLKLQRQQSQPAHEREKDAETEQISLRDAFKFPIQFWLICAIVVAFYGGVFPFNQNAPDLMGQIWAISENV